ncbi:hypothetical protein, partial [Streptomyces sp. IBSBF 2390]|uniref:hypothetical protein n=1 Tax=Streptomyces sp. IBSBF 2390 TaxID=2903533 RepID=UPI003FA777D2
MVKDCKNVLNLLGNLCNLTILWVPGHTNIQGNEDADLLARQGSDLHISWKVKIPTPPSFFNAKISDELTRCCKGSWSKTRFPAKYIWTD